MTIRIASSVRLKAVCSRAVNQLQPSIGFRADDCPVLSTGLGLLFDRLCGWYNPFPTITMFLIVGAGMGPIFALKYYRYTYRPSKINILQQAERTGGPIVTLGNIETQPRTTMEKEVSPLSITQPKNRSPVYEPLLSDLPNAT